MGRLCAWCKRKCCFGRKQRVQFRKSLMELPVRDRHGIIRDEYSSESITSVANMSLEDLSPHYKDLDQMYKHAVQTMVNFIGMPSYPFISHAKMLYPYIMLLCDGINQELIFQVKNDVKRELKNLQVTITLKEAKIIHPKFSEFSNVYCKLWIEGGSKRLSTVKDNTSNLKWNETFVLDVKNYETDSIFLEMWSSRPGIFERMTKSESQGYKENDPLEKYSGKYFIGDAIQDVKSMPCMGQEVFWDLRKGTGRTFTRGQMNLYVQLNVKKEKKDFNLHFHVHMAFIRMCYEKQLESNQATKLWKNWLEILPNPALCLIQQHAMQHGIAPTEQALCSWLVTSSLIMRKEDRISFYLLKVLLDEMCGITSQKFLQEYEAILVSSFRDFFVFSTNMLLDLHVHFNVLCVEMADELFCMLKCMLKIENYLGLSCLDTYEILKNEAKTWYLHILVDYKGELEEEDDNVEKTGETLKRVMKVYLRNQIILDDIFKRAWKANYTNIVNSALDNVLYSAIKPIIQHLMEIVENPTRKRRAVESLKMLQLYHTVRNVVNYVTETLPRRRKHSNLEDFSMWFGKNLILEWFLLCDIYTKPFIKRAVLADPMERISKKYIYGTSVPDVQSIIDEIVVDVWMKLKWEDQFYTHGALIEAVRSCVLEYGKSIAECTEMTEQYWKAQGFQIDSKMCVALSNLVALNEHLHKTKAKVKAVMRTAEIQFNFTTTDLMMQVESDFLMLMSEVFLSALHKINLSVQREVKRMVRSKLDAVVSRNLLHFIEKTLGKLRLNLKLEPFYVMLKELWTLILLDLDQGINFSKTCLTLWRIQPDVYLIIRQALDQLQDILNCDGHGLSRLEMETYTYKELEKKLDTKIRKKYKS